MLIFRASSVVDSELEVGRPRSFPAWLHAGSRSPIHTDSRPLVYFYSVVVVVVVLTKFKLLTNQKGVGAIVHVYRVARVNMTKQC